MFKLAISIYVVAYSAGASAQASQFECERAQRNAATTASSIHPDRGAIAAARRQADVICFGPARAAELERERIRAAALRDAQDTPPPAAHPATITHCAGGFCYTDRGDALPRIGR